MLLRSEISPLGEATRRVRSGRVLGRARTSMSLRASCRPYVVRCERRGRVNVRAFPVRRTRPRATRASPGKSSFRHAFPTWLRCEKGKDAGGFGATAAGLRVIRFRARAHHATPASLIDDDHHLHIGPGRVIRLRRELVLSLGLFVRDPKYVAHEPRPLHCYLVFRTPRGSAFARSARCSRAVRRVRTNDTTGPAPRRVTRARGGVRLSRTAPREAF